MPYTYADYYNARTSQPISQLSSERQMLQQLLGMQGGASVYTTNGMMQRPGDNMLKQAGMTREQFLRMQALQRGRQMSGMTGNVGGGMAGMQRPPGMMHGGMKPPGPMGGMPVHPYAQQQQAYGVPQAQASTGVPSYAAPQMTHPTFLRGRPSGFPRKPQKPLPYIAY